MQQIPHTTRTLTNGTKMPIIGFGTFRLTGKDAYSAVTEALRVGYRHIDTALRYDNHTEVGRAIKESGLPRDELFITSKLFFEHYPKDAVRAAVEQALQELGLEYLDLVLIHWPDRSQSFEETLSVLAACQEAGLVREIGVSNFTVNHLKDALATGVPFSVNQVEFHPSLNQEELLQFCNEHDIVLTAYSPIAQGKDLELPLVQELSEKYERSGSQIILNWLIAKGIVAIPRSNNVAHIEDNFHATEFLLETDDRERLDQVNTNTRIINPSFADFTY